LILKDHQHTAAARSAGRGRTTVVGSDETGSAAAARSTGRCHPAVVGSDEMGSDAAAATGSAGRSNVDMNVEKTVATARNTERSKGCRKH